MLFDEIKSVLSRISKSELRKFGITTGLFLLAVSAILLWKNKDAFPFLVLPGVGLALLGLLLPGLLKPIYIAWMSCAVTIGYFMTRLILSLLYALVFSPVGLVLRLIGKDLLHEKIDQQQSSYWMWRERGQFEPQSVENQY